MIEDYADNELKTWKVLKLKAPVIKSVTLLMN